MTTINIFYQVPGTDKINKSKQNQGGILEWRHN